MKKITFTILILAGGLHFAIAQAPSAEQSTPPETQPSTTEATPGSAPIELKNKSSFATQEAGRNPFWPIGWKPAAKQAANTSAISEAAGPEVQPSAFVVTSIVMDPRARFAIINGKVMNEGQVFGLQMGSSTYQITVKAIEDGRVVLVRGRDQEIIVQLRRR